MSKRRVKKKTVQKSDKNKNLAKKNKNWQNLKKRKKEKRQQFAKFKRMREKKNKFGPKKRGGGIIIKCDHLLKKKTKRKGQKLPK